MRHDPAMEREHLEAILAAPDDDAPRLVYADWLLGQGDSRSSMLGELIQLQCRLAEDLTTAARRKMRIAENKLLAGYEAQTAGDISELLGFARDARVVKVQLRRGFVHRIKAPVSLLKRLDEVAAIAPLLEEIEVQAEMPFDQSTVLTPSDFESAHLARVRAIRFSLPQITLSSVEVIARAPLLANIRSFGMVGTHWAPRGDAMVHFGAAMAKVLVASPVLKLTSLELDENALFNAGVETLLTNSWSLESLSIANNGCTGPAFRSVARAPTMASVKRLVMSSTRYVAPEQIAELASSPHLRGLQALDIERCDLGKEGIKAFLDAFDLPNLEELIIASNTIAEAGGLTLAASNKLRGLRVLDITKNRLSKKAISALADSMQFVNLKKLLLHDRDTPDTRATLAGSKVLANTQVYFRGHLVPKSD
jgi:uncharacterized protein (TIGR02996 family)